MSDPVEHPNHYADHFPFEVIEAIKLILNQLCHRLTPYECYCVGSALKYRLRAGLKGPIDEDIHKALKYMDLYDE